MDVLFKVVNNIKLSEIDIFFQGHENSIRTYGPGFYFSTSKEYCLDYVSPQGYSLLLTLEADISNSYEILKKDLPSEDDLDDNIIFIGTEIVNKEDLTLYLSDYDFVFLDDDREIAIVPKGRKPSIKINSVEILTDNELVLKEIQELGKNPKKLDPIDFVFVDEILEKFYK